MTTSQQIAEPVLVTGATGFIGRRIVAQLLREKVRTRALVLPHDAIPEDWGDAVDIRRGDVTQRASVAAAVQGAKIVIHLAALVSDWGDAALHRRVTVRGTENVLSETARCRARAILCSSVVIYGDALDRDVCSEEHPFGRAFSHYSRSKQEQERIARRLEEAQSLKVTIIRPGNVYGPGAVHWVDMVVAHLRTGLPSLVDDGRRIAGLAYVDNVADIFVRAAAQQACVGRTYNVTDDAEVTWRRYFGDLAKLSGAPEPKSLARPLLKVMATGYECSYKLLQRRDRPPITHEVLNLVGSNYRVPITRARKDLGFEPLVRYQDGIKAVGAYLAASARA